MTRAILRARPRAWCPWCGAKLSEHRGAGDWSCNPCLRVLDGRAANDLGFRHEELMKLPLAQHQRRVLKELRPEGWRAEKMDAQGYLVLHHPIGGRLSVTKTPVDKDYEVQKKIRDARQHVHVGQALVDGFLTHVRREHNVPQWGSSDAAMNVLDDVRAYVDQHAVGKPVSLRAEVIRDALMQTGALKIVTPREKGWATVRIMGSEYEPGPFEPQKLGASTQLAQPNRWETPDEEALCGAGHPVYPAVWCTKPPDHEEEMHAADGVSDWFVSTDEEEPEVDEAARMEEHSEWARQIARKWFIPGADRDDVTQIALMALHEAIRDYDPAKGSFRGFARLVIERTIMDHVNAAGREKRGGGVPPVSLDAPIPGRDDNEDRSLHDVVPGMGIDPAEAFLLKQRMEQLGDALTTLSDLERATIEGSATGLSYSEISAQFDHYDEKAVDNALQRARLKIRAALALHEEELPEPKTLACDAQRMHDDALCVCSEPFNHPGDHEDKYRHIGWPRTGGKPYSTQPGVRLTPVQEEAIVPDDRNLDLGVFVPRGVNRSTQRRERVARARELLHEHEWLVGSDLAVALGVSQGTLPAMKEEIRCTVWREARKHPRTFYSLIGVEPKLPCTSIGTYPEGARKTPPPDWPGGAATSVAAGEPEAAVTAPVEQAQPGPAPAAAPPEPPAAEPEEPEMAEPEATLEQAEAAAEPPEPVDPRVEHPVTLTRTQREPVYEGVAMPKELFESMRSFFGGDEINALRDRITELEMEVAQLRDDSETLRAMRQLLNPGAAE